MWFIPEGYEPPKPSKNQARRYQCAACEVTWIAKPYDRSKCWVCGAKANPNTKITHSGGTNYRAPENGEPYELLCDSARADL